MKETDLLLGHFAAEHLAGLDDQGFDDFDDTELEASIALTYWLSDNHGLSLGYTHNSLGETDYIGLQYLYSWE